MSISIEFKDAVDKGLKTRVRIMLKDMMCIAPNLNDFYEMRDYANKRMPDLYDQHDGEILKTDPSAWDKNYMNQQLVSVVRNFSEERVELLSKIIQKIYAYKLLDSPGDSVNKMNRNHFSNILGDLNTQQVAGGLVAVIGIGALISGAITSSTTFVVVGGIGLVGGVAFTFLGDRKEK